MSHVTQVNFLAHPGTSGASYVDHIIADRVVAPPDHALFFSESILVMSHHYQVCAREREREREGVCVREREGESVCVCVRETEWMHLPITNPSFRKMCSFFLTATRCVCEREMCVCVYACVCVI